MHSAGAALRDAAAELGAGEPELLADHPQQRRIARLLGIDFPAVDGEFGHCFAPPSGTAMLVRKNALINGTESTASVRTPRLPAIGRSKNANRRPSALIIE